MIPTDGQSAGVAAQIRAVRDAQYPSHFPKRDFVMLNHVKSPGICVIRGAGSPRDWKENRGAATSGAWLVFNGVGLAKFSIDFHLWDELAHPAEWQAFAGAALETPPVGKRAEAMQIEHPLLTFPPLNIQMAVLLNVGQAEQDERGGWIMSCEFQQFAGAPKAVVAKPADTKGVKTALEQPKDPREQAIADLHVALDAAAERAARAGAR